MEKSGEFRRADYSLTGKDSGLAVEKGLADAAWYAPPLPKEELHLLLERRDGPALRGNPLPCRRNYSLASSSSSHT